ncbi:2-methylisocitrate lyase-like PEP mutase family enzyme [Sphingomonas vulcanisoli]|uniref:2-methylisocitrate lyase-like PEP mutase family enzyme n=1 Tax=Sphingomonas vulcanisoli TaxID=1658060 RepID=A0ABX0TSS4_9SPHN|nr:isocitrate lyase/PEP mutase family protein [Sphingomonas vulcanisoli]NIJ08563.1 2-methylisocitrate lyase-like PEP mutase family enzyme [Sphingomonas vulcanisoli]
MANPILREKLARGEFIAAPGIQDMITAVVANKVGFDIVYGSGYWLTASASGLPDAGIATFTQMLDRMATLVKTSNAAVIADGDTGYGGLLNVHHTVRGYEEAGVTAIQLEDQEFPKKCGHTPYRRVIPLEDMVDKIKVAVDARRDDNFLIIARTDARQGEGFERSLARAKAYGEAGADILFVEALESEEEMRRANDALTLPTMANMATGGLTPILSTARLAELGFSVAIFPALTSLIAAKAMEGALRTLKETGDGNPGDVFDFKEFCGLIGFQEVWDFEKKWGQDGAR